VKDEAFDTVGTSDCTGFGAGVDATTVAHRVGHASTRMTLDRYAHALPAGDVAAAALIGALLPEAGNA